MTSSELTAIGIAAAGGLDDLPGSAVDALTTIEALRPANDQRHAHRAFVELNLLPDAVLAQHVAVVRGVDDDPVVEILPRLLKSRQ